MSRLKEMLKRHEGFRSKPYRCTEGKLTCAYGRNLQDVGVSEDEGEYMLDNDIKKIQQGAASFDWYFHLNQARKDAVCDMIFNVGLQGFMGFKKTIKAIAINDYEKAADEMMDSKWSQQVGKRAYELSQMMRTGEYLNKQGEG